MSVGASFTAQATVPGVASVVTASVSGLQGGQASRTSAGVASVTWDEPALRADEAEYVVERTVGSVTSVIDPVVTAADGAVGFVDDLTVPAVDAASLVGIDAGFYHTCGVTEAGAVACWGSGIYGALGNGSAQQRPTPTLVDVSALPGTPRFRSVSAGDEHTCALTEAGEIYCWGMETYGRLGVAGAANRWFRPVSPVEADLSPGDRFVSVSGGSWHTCALTQAGRVFCWGNGGGVGSLGDGRSDIAVVPVEVSRTHVPSGAKFVAIDSGSTHTCAVIETGRAYCWGMGGDGQLGHGARVNAHVPTAVNMAAFPGERLVSVAAGYASTCALAASGAVYCWGFNRSGQLADGTTASSLVPVRALRGSIPQGREILSISAFHEHVCVLVDDGSAHCWGSDEFGQLGRGGSGYASQPVAVARAALPPDARLTQLSAGVEHTCALSADHGAFCWGLGAYGRLGDGSTASHRVPARVDHSGLPQLDPCDPGWVAVAGHRCAPGADIAVGYRIDHSLRGWTPPQPLLVSAPVADIP
ncbi:RCC1 domain-containing protein [Microbacterium album]|uniref:RCC1 domain-containing protein n=1 Tax=Microbacterium album TaxID=2053191 RepID=UPI001666F3EA|nr:hypothetical protein [Microbacterium album]